MNNHQPVLNIIIPTYNRVSFLETTVNGFIAQIQEYALEGTVEIVIADDCSPDGTRSYLEKLTATYPFVTAFTNVKNLGLSGNVEKLVATARAPFLWLFGEDDLITEGALKKVVDSIVTEDPNIILVNTVNMVSLDDRNLQYKIIGENRLNITQDLFIESFEKEKVTLAEVKSWLYLTNLVSASAFKKEFFLAGLTEAKRYVRPENVYLFQASLIIGIAKQGRFKIIAQRGILHRKNETHWSKTLHGNFLVSLYDGSEIVKLIKKYMPSEYAAYQRIFAMQTFIAVRKAKEQRLPVTKYIIDALMRYYRCYPYTIRFLIALVTPGGIFKIYQKK